jgi:hypothetical protein
MEYFKAIFCIFLLALPFLFAGAISLELAKERGARLGWCLFVATVAVLALNLAWGFHTSAALGAERKWTGATLTLGVMALRSIPIVFLCWFVRGRLGKPAPPR